MYRAGTGNFGEFSPYTINFRGLCNSGGARAPAAPPSSVPMTTLFKDEECMLERRVFFREINFAKNFREIDYTENLRLPEDQYLDVL